MKRLFCKLLSVVMVAIVASSCYDEYKTDYEFTSTYFSLQQPLRTIVEGDDFKVGVAITGFYEVESSVRVNFAVDPSIVPASKTQLPTDYYKLSNNNTMVVPEGDIVGDVVVDLDWSKLIVDSKAFTGEYVLPLRITDTQTDQINMAKSTTMVAIKCVLKQQGDYWLKGSDTTYASDGTTVVDVKEYSETPDDLVTNKNTSLVTINRNNLAVNHVGNFSTASMTLEVDNDGNPLALNNADSGLTDLKLTQGEYDATDKTYALNYEYKDASGALHKVAEEWVFIKLPLQVEEWK